MGKFLLQPEADGVDMQTAGGLPPPALLPDLFPWDDLTERAGSLIQTSSSPFTQDLQYALFFEQLFRRLHMSSPRHVLMLRERGVGDQAVLIEAALRGLQGQPPFLSRHRLVALDLRTIGNDELAPAIAAVFAAASSSEYLILCIDGLANVLRQRGIVDYRVKLLAGLSRCRCRVIAMLTPHEYEELVCCDPEARDLFSTVSLNEPATAVAIELVSYYAAGLQIQFDVVIEQAVARRAVVLTANYVLHERLPYKAVKLLRSICEDIRYERSQHSSPRREVTEYDVVKKVAEVIGVPFETLAGVGEEVDYHKSLGKLIVGQDHAVREVATELGLIKAGFVDAGKPASVMLFIGQTGTGKTEMAKALARFYSSSKRLKTFTLGNFSEPHSVSGIIGVPAGYVGHDQGGRLVNELNSDPYGVFLLDEADKAHPDVMQPFLNLFDEGWVLDQRGVKAYADRAIFILTTNVGQRQISELCKSDKTIEEITSTMKESISRIRHTKSNRPVFSPEFLARVKRVVVFRSLDLEAMLGICRSLVMQLQTRWVEQRQKSLHIENQLIEAIARRGAELDEKSNGKEGGRIIRKLLADVVEAPIQVAISRNADQYRSCETVSLSYRPIGFDILELPMSDLASCMTVRFEPDDEAKS